MDSFLDFVSHLSVMKPASIDDTNPNHLKKINDILKSSDFLADEKIDGCHYLLINARFFSTEGVEKTNNYPHIRDFFRNLEMPNLILDGEINYPNKTSQFCTRVTGSAPDVAITFQNDYGPIHYTMWDILRTPKGTWLLNEPLWKRRTLLQEFYRQFIQGTEISKYVHLVSSTVNDKKDFYDSLIQTGREGVVLKRLDSLYIMGKKPMWQWMKLKQKDEADFFISGYDEATVLYSGSNIENWQYWREIKGVLHPVTKYHYLGWIGAIQLSAYVNGKSTLICTCSGMDENVREQLSKTPSAFINRVVKTSFMEKTEAGIPRHPRFEGFHESKKAIECTWELIDN